MAALWGMEKCKAYLYGREFDLITDHKAIESYFNKDNFGNSRIQRWFDRLSEFSFVPKYRAGEEMTSVDALSRSMTDDSISFIKFDISESLFNQVMKIHKSLNHRRSISNDLKKNNIKISQEKIDSILSECITCIQNDRK